MITWLVIAIVVSSLLIAIAGRRLRFGFWGYFFGSLLLTPIIGLLLLLAAWPTREQKRALRKAGG